MQTSGVAGVMIGRAAMGNPWVLARTAHYLATGELLSEPTPDMRLDTALAHVRKLLEFKGERIGVAESRKHVSWYITGMPRSAESRQRAKGAGDFDDLFDAGCDRIKTQPGTNQLPGKKDSRAIEWNFELRGRNGMATFEPPMDTFIDYWVIIDVYMSGVLLEVKVAPIDPAGLVAGGCAGIICSPGIISDDVSCI